MRNPSETTQVRLRIRLASRKAKAARRVRRHHHPAVARPSARRWRRQGRALRDPLRSFCNVYINITKRCARPLRAIIRESHFCSRWSGFVALLTVLRLDADEFDAMRGNVGDVESAVATFATLHPAIADVMDAFNSGGGEVDADLLRKRRTGAGETTLLLVSTKQLPV